MVWHTLLLGMPARDRSVVRLCRREVRCSSWTQGNDSLKAVVYLSLLELEADHDSGELPGLGRCRAELRSECLTGRIAQVGDLVAEVFVTRVVGIEEQSKLELFEIGE